MVGSAIEGPHKPNGTVGARPREQRRGNRGHATAEKRSVFAVVPRRKALLGHRNGRVAKAAVDEAFGWRLCALHPVGRFHVCGAGAGVWEHEGGGGVHGWLDSHLGVRRTVAGEHGAGLEVLLHEVKLVSLFFV